MPITDPLWGNDPYGAAGGYGSVPTNLAMTHAAGGSLPGGPDASMQTPYQYGLFRPVSTLTINNEIASQRKTILSLSIKASEGRGVFGLNVLPKYTIPGAFNPSKPADLQAIYARREMENATEGMKAGIKDIGVGAASMLLPFAIPGAGLVAPLAASIGMTSLLGGSQDRVLKQQRLAQDIAATTTAFMNTPGKDLDPETQMGLNRQATKRMAMRFQNGGYGPSRELFKEGDYLSILQAGTQAGLFDKSTNEAKIHEQMHRLSNVAATIMAFSKDADVSAIMNMLGTFSRQGTEITDTSVPGMENRVKRRFSQLLSASRITGRSTEDILGQEGAYGAMLFASKGLSPEAGAVASVRNLASARLAVKGNLLSSSMLGRMGGEQGYRQMLDIMGANAGEAVSQGNLLKLFEDENGDLDYGKLEEFKKSGTLPVKDYNDFIQKQADVVSRQGPRGVMLSNLKRQKNAQIFEEAVGLGGMRSLALQHDFYKTQFLDNALGLNLSRDEQLQYALQTGYTGRGINPYHGVQVLKTEAATASLRDYSEGKSLFDVNKQERAVAESGDGFINRTTRKAKDVLYNAQTWWDNLWAKESEKKPYIDVYGGQDRQVTVPDSAPATRAPASFGEDALRQAFPHYFPQTNAKPAAPATGQTGSTQGSGWTDMFSRAAATVGGAFSSAGAWLGSLFSATPAQAATLDGALRGAFGESPSAIRAGGSAWERRRDSGRVLGYDSSAYEAKARESAPRRRGPGAYYEEQKPGEDTTLNIPVDGQLGFLSQWRETGKDGSHSVSMDSNGYSSYGLSQLNTAPGNSMGTFVGWLKDTGRTDVLSLFDSAKNSDGSYDWQGENSRFAQIWRENTRDPNSPLSRADRDFMGHYLEGSYQQLERMGFDSDTMQRLRSSPTFREVAMAMTRQGPTAALMRNLTNAYAVRHGMETGKPWDSYSPEQQRDIVREYSAMDIPQLVSSITAERSRLTPDGSRLAYWANTRDPQIHRSLMAAFSKENAIFSTAAQLEAQGKFRLNADGSYGYSGDFSSAVQRAGLSAKLLRPGSTEAYLEGNEAVPGSVNDYDAKRALADELMQASMSEGRVRSSDTSKDNAMVLSEINPEMVIRAEAAMKELKDDYGYDVGYSSTYRTADDQARIKAKYGDRAGWKSNHQRGLAFDFTIAGKPLGSMSSAEYSKIQDVFAKYGLYTPLSHMDGERQHVEMRQRGSNVFGGTQASLQAAYDRLGRGAAPAVNGAHYKDDYVLNPKDRSAYGRGGGNPRSGGASRAKLSPGWLSLDSGASSKLDDPVRVDLHNEAKERDILMDETHSGYGYAARNLAFDQEKFTEKESADREGRSYSDYYALGTVIAGGGEAENRADKDMAAAYGRVYDSYDKGVAERAGKLPVLFEHLRNLSTLKESDFSDGEAGLRAYRDRAVAESMSYLRNAMGMSEKEAKETFQRLYETRDVTGEAGRDASWEYLGSKLKISRQDYDTLVRTGGYSSEKLSALAAGKGMKVGDYAMKVRELEKKANYIGESTLYQGQFNDRSQKLGMARDNYGARRDEALSRRDLLRRAGATFGKESEWLHGFGKMPLAEKKAAVEKLKEALKNPGEGKPQVYGQVGQRLLAVLEAATQDRNGNISLPSGRLFPQASNFGSSAPASSPSVTVQSSFSKKDANDIVQTLSGILEAVKKLPDNLKNVVGGRPADSGRPTERSSNNN